ncbi:MAG: hypothetical protein ACOH5I_06380 [Oligoflexus sp.]
MGRNNQARRKEKKRKSGRGKGRSRSPALNQNEMLNLQTMELMANFSLNPQAYHPDMVFAEIHQINENNSSPVWSFQRQLSELLIQGRIPQPTSPSISVKDFYELFVSSSFAENLGQIQLYAKAFQQADLTQFLFDYYQNRSAENFATMDIPALALLILENKLPEEHPATTYFFEQINDWLTDLPQGKELDFSKIFFYKRGKPSQASLKSLEQTLMVLERYHNYPLTRQLLQPFFKQFIKRRLRQIELKVFDKFPRLRSIYLEHELPEKSTDKPDTIDVQDIDAPILKKLMEKSKSIQNYQEHILSLLIHWRLVSQQREVKRGQENKLAFSNLWSALNRGVRPDQKAFAESVKAEMLRFCLHRLKRNPEQRLSKKEIEVFHDFAPEHPVFTWLAYAESRFRERKLLKDLPSSSPSMDPDVFLTLMNQYGLATRPEFIELYFDRLPREAKREILIPWLRYHSKLPKRDIDGFSYRADFSERRDLCLKLLKPQQFPVKELFTATHLEPELVAWSLVYLHKHNSLDFENIHPDCLPTFLDFLLQYQDVLFYHEAGKSILLELMTKMTSLGHPQTLAPRLIQIHQTFSDPKTHAALVRILEYRVSTQVASGMWNDYLSRIQPRKKIQKNHLPRKRHKPQSSLDDFWI